MTSPAVTHSAAGTLFSNSYAHARQRVLAVAAARGLTVESHTLPLRGADNEALAMDVVRDGPAQASRVLLLTSAVHGVEGHCGSAVQLGLLTLRPDLRSAADADLAVVHVHAVNPHGFSYGRRVNEDNVDLNRNFINFQQALPDNSNYRELHPLLLPEHGPPRANVETALSQRQQALGPRRFQRAVSGGPYSHPDGLFYGGQAPTWSNRVFRDVLRRHAGLARHLAWIDLHTGICLEFGTVPSADMHAALRADHWLHAQQTAQPRPIQPTPQQARAIWQKLHDVFDPDHDDWKAAIWAQASEAAEQAVAGLRAS